MKKFGLLFSFLLLTTQLAWGQLLNENFEYSTGQLTAVNGGADVSGGNWVNYNGTTLPLQVTSGSLTYSGYASSGIGNKVDVMNGSAEDAYRQFTTQGVGTKTYAAFIINVSTTTGLSANTSTTGDYTVSFMPSTSTSTLLCRVSLRAGSVANTFNVGLRTTSSNAAAVWNATDYPINTDILVVFSYEIISGNTNDIANLWVNPTLGGSEPTADLTQTSALTADPVDVARITIRQGTNSFPGQLDGIRIGTTWASIIPAAGTPAILITPNSLSDFNYVVGSGPSTSQSYSLSGSDLTGYPDNITVTGSTNYDVSTDNSTFGTSVTVAYTSSTLTSTTIYVRLKSGLSVGTYNGETISNAGGGATTQNVTCSGEVYDVEPTNHVTGFAAALGTPSHSAITVTWTDATGTTVPDGYLIKGSNVGYGSITVPADGTPEVNSTLVINVAQGTGTYTFSGLSANTTYYFKIYPYTNTGTGIDYKTDGTVPQDDIATDAAPTLPNAWINELHYDNDGTDAGEFVEVLIQNPGDYTLSDFLITLYNGSGGVSYGTHDLSSFTVGILDPVDNTYRYYSKAIAGIQNGSPDGLCLSYQGTVIQFLSYEGTFSATDGPAIGVSSSDIGIYQPGDVTNPVGSSIGLTGTGTQYSDFSWTTFSDDTPGSPNGSQALPVELTSFSATTIGSTIKLSWQTATEINNYGFDIERSSVKGSWEKIGFVNGNGNSNSPKNYSFVDDNVTAGIYSYRLKQIDNDGQFEYSKAIEIGLTAPDKFELSQNYPNPFNPSTTINYNLPEASNVKLIIYNILGQEVKTLVNAFKEAGVHTIDFNASELNSGLYIYKIEAGSFVQTRKMTLIK